MRTYKIAIGTWGVEIVRCKNLEEAKAMARTLAGNNQRIDISERFGTLDYKFLTTNRVQIKEELEKEGSLYSSTNWFTIPKNSNFCDDDCLRNYLKNDENGKETDITVDESNRGWLVERCPNCMEIRNVIRIESEDNPIPYSQVYK